MFGAETYHLEYAARQGKPVMSSSIDPLILDLVEWVAQEPRAYTDVMDAWRTSCPRLTVWEDAVDCGLVRRESNLEAGFVVVVTPEGRQLLQEHGRR
jgi:hypothetical protein